jgi:hypothetical protein
MNTFSYFGNIKKLNGVLENPIQYTFSLASVEIPLNPELGRKLTLEFTGKIHCIYCRRLIKKSYNQGYCYPCSTTLARNDLCIVKPERCHHHLGTCREPEWGTLHCLIPHIVYVANTSGLKVGITRAQQLFTRWIDQGATTALAFLRTNSRLTAGEIEVTLAKEIEDKTNWRKMLQGVPEPVDLIAVREALFNNRSWASLEAEKLQQAVTVLHFPILDYPKKVKSIRLDKEPKLEGTFLGVKGQYILLDTGVLNIRSHAGFEVGVTFS